MDRTESGFSLIEVIVAMGIMLVIGLGLTSMIASQNQEMRSLSERMFVKDVQIQLKNVLLNDTFCGCLFRGKTLNTTGVPAFSSNLTNVPSAWTQPIPAIGNCTALGTDLIPAATTAFPGSQIKVSTLAVQDITVMTPGNYTANIAVTIDPTSVLRPMKPFMASIMFSVNQTDPANAQSFLSCGAPISRHYSTSCVFGQGGYNTFACCRMDTKDGTARCQEATAQYPWIAWQDAGSPFTVPAVGDFEISCVGGAQYQKMTCCRTDRAAGNVTCRERIAAYQPPPRAVPAWGPATPSDPFP